jgi:sugar phosphate isomerase/epimerase
MRLLSVAIAMLLVGVPAAPGGLTPAGRVLVGYCVGLKDIEVAKQAGFDFAEVRTVEISALSDVEFDALVARVQAIGLPTPSAYQFLPDRISLTGPQPATPEIETAYVTRAFARLARLGVHLVGFGSGGARRVPDGFSKRAAFDQLVAFGRRIAPIARANNLVVAIEPQRPEESNIVNSAAEGLTLVDAVDDPAFQLLVDFFHMASVKEDPAVIQRAGPHVRHLHMANPNGRVFPLSASEYDYSAFFRNLRAIGYSGLISVEASSADVAADAPRTIAMLRDELAGAK